MTTHIDLIMNAASRLATKRIRRFALNQPNYRGLETEKQVQAAVEQCECELREAIVAALIGKPCPES